MLGLGPDRTYATTLQDIARGVYELENCSGGNLDYPSLSSDDAVDIALSYTSVPWEDLDAYDPDKFDAVVASTWKAARQDIIEAIHAAALAKRERDAVAELKQREAQSRAAEADLLAQLDAEAGAAPKKLEPLGRGQGHARSKRHRDRVRKDVRSLGARVGALEAAVQAQTSKLDMILTHLIRGRQKQ